MSIIELNDVKYEYKNKYQTVSALRGCSCGFECGRTYAVVGKSGSGKTTMLSLMAGLDLPTSGQILYDGESISDMELDAYRRTNVAVIYQNFQLFPLLTAKENVMYPMQLCKVSDAQASFDAEAALISVGITKEQFGRFPGMLSGGEQQRVAIARALCMNTKLLLADEPTGNLDTENTGNIIDLLVTLAKEKGYCVIIITHDTSILPKIDVVYKMTDGVITLESEK